MNQEIKQEWVKALRSGEYDQGKDELRSYANTYCCLGVLCDLYSKKTGVKWIERTSICDEEVKFYTIHGSTWVLPNEVIEWAQVHAHAPTIHLSDDRESYSTRSALNDSGVTFTDIAKFIEGQL